MTDVFDRATEREESQRRDAIEAQERRAGLVGKTIADSATHCRICEERIPEERIPEERRKALPGVQTCVSCQADLELTANRFNH